MPVGVPGNVHAAEVEEIILEFPGVAECAVFGDARGKPLAFAEVKIAGDDGRTLGPNQLGEILGRSPNAVTAYFENAEKSAETFRDGWVHTGDLGSLDEEGYLAIRGRKKDMIGGERVTGLVVAQRDAEIDPKQLGELSDLFGPCGARRALQIFLMEDSFGAPQAEIWGLVNKVVPEVDLPTATQTLAERLVSLVTKRVSLHAADHTGARGSPMDAGEDRGSAFRRTAPICFYCGR